MTILKNKNLRKSKKKLIFIFSVLIIASLNLFGEFEEERIYFRYYYDYTNKIYHSTLKTEIIPSEYLFITTYSYTNISYYNYNYNTNYKYTNLYLYNLKTKEKKLFYVGEYGFYRDSLHNYKYINYEEYYDINGNLTTNWTDTNMKANEFYEITNNRFGETFYNQYGGGITIRIIKDNDYIQKAYKYSLTQPETVKKRERGLYLFYNSLINNFVSMLCFQNEYYKNRYDNYLVFEEVEEKDLLNYSSNGDIEFTNNIYIRYTYQNYDTRDKIWNTPRSVDSFFRADNHYKLITNYFNLNQKIFLKPKPSYEQITNNLLQRYNNISKTKNVINKYYYTTEDMKENLKRYKESTDFIKFILFIPIEEFEYYLLAY